MPEEVLTDDELRGRAIDLLDSVWLSLDHRNMRAGRRMGIWDEMTGRVRSALHAPTLVGFVERLARKLGVMSLRVDASAILDALSVFDKVAMLALIRAEPLVMCCELRARRDEKREEREQRLKRRSV